MSVYFISIIYYIKIYPNFSTFPGTPFFGVDLGKSKLCTTLVFKL